MQTFNSNKIVIKTILVLSLVFCINYSFAQNTGTGTGTTGTTSTTSTPSTNQDKPPTNQQNPDKTNSATNGQKNPDKEGVDGKDGMEGVDDDLVSNEEYEQEMEQRAARERSKREYMIDGVRIFGSELFAGANRSTGSIINRPAPSDYVLGPGDQLLFDITGINLTSFTTTVQPDGSITLREFGKVFVSGKSLDGAREVVKNKLNANSFSIDRGSTLEASVTSVRTFTVNVMGEVKRPGSKLVGTFNTVLDALNMAGGITNIGTFRHIQLIRDGRLYSEIDLYDMIINGDYSQNFYLKDDDLIQVRPYSNRVAMTGAIKRERWFEVKQNENLHDILNFSGGYTANAYTNIIKAIQYTDEQMRVRDIKFDDMKHFIPVNGDKYIVDVILNRIENRVVVQGAVFRPGNFELETTPTLLMLIEKAEGLTEAAFTTRAYLTRTNQESGAQENITIDLQGIVNGTIPDIPLQREDVLTVRSSFDLTDQSSVTIAGKVRSPGTFNFYYGMTVEDLILLADGYSDGADYQMVQIVRRVKDSDKGSKDARLAEVFTITVDPYLKLSETSFKLEPYDVISIRPLRGYVKPILVRIEGEVMYPGTYPMLKRNDRISDLLERAGGATQLSYLKGASFMRIERATTSNEIYIDQYRKNLRTIENKLNVAEGYAGERVNVGEVAAQLNPNFITIDLEQILKNPKSQIDIVLKAGDVLSVPIMHHTVEIRGQVSFPTIAVYEEGKEVLDYIKNDAGGFNDMAYKKNTTVEYMNGRASSKRLFGNFPEVEPGAVIYVPAKTITVKQRTNYTSLIGLGSSLASTAALIITVMRVNSN